MKEKAKINRQKLRETLTITKSVSIIAKQQNVILQEQHILNIQNGTCFSTGAIIYKHTYITTIAQKPLTVKCYNNLFSCNIKIVFILKQTKKN